LVKYVIRRLLLTIPVILGVTVMTFFLANVLPGDPARMAAGQFANPEQIQQVSERLGLDKPLPVQYFRYLGRLLRGDLGESLTSRQEILAELGKFYPATLELTAFAIMIAVFIGTPLGVITGTGKSPIINSVVMFFSFLGVGMPVFWTGLILQLVFAGKLDILPLSGRLSIGHSAPPSVTNMYTIDAIIAGEWKTFWDAILHLIMPALTLSIGRVASIARITHASMLSVMRSDYIRTARAKGLKDTAVLVRHGLRNALLPTSTTIGLQIGFLLGGAILVENIFSWGGIGTYAWVGLFRLDIPVIMGVTLAATFTFMIVNLLVDIVYPLLDPRIVYK